MFPLPLKRLLWPAALLIALSSATAFAASTPAPLRTVRVKQLGDLRAAVSAAKPGTRIEIEPGEYAGGFFTKDLKGEAAHPIVICAADPQRPPVLHGGIQIVDAAYVELADLTLTGFAGNAIAIDDGGTYDTPAHHVTLRRLRITDIGPTGNYHAVKYAGVDDFVITGCTFERWGIGAGLAIDCVGCHRGLIENCNMRHDEDPKKAGSVGIQVKGACREIVIRGNRLENCGDRGMNIGGSTGQPFFRPTLAAWPAGTPRYEASQITVEGNTIIGGNAAIAFVNTESATVRANTIYAPRQWAVRILQETGDPSFVPSQKGAFADNLIAFRSNQWFEGGFNVGPKTAPNTFQFSHNWWYCLDAPAKSQPRPPTAETGGVYGKDPGFVDAAKLDLRLKPGSPASGFGAAAAKP